METPQRSIRFLLYSQLQDIMFNPARKEPLEFTCEDPEINLSIRSEPIGNDLHSGFRNLVCKVTCELPADSDLVEFVQGLENGRYIAVPGAPLRLPVYSKGVEYIDSSGNILAGTPIFAEHCPPSLQELCSQVRTRLEERQERFLRMLCWRQNIDAPHSIFESAPSLHFCVTGSKYMLIPQVGEESRMRRSPRGIRWSDDKDSAVRSLWSDLNISEPLAHELLREAIHLYQSAPRSSLIMTATAIEIGVKKHISRVQPITSWLLEKMPSPPVHKVLRDYLHSIHEGSSAIKDWNALKHLWKKCEEIAMCRNALAHNTGANPDNDILISSMSTAHDVLYILDVLEGHTWARDFVEKKIRDSQGWPEPEQHDFLVKVSTSSPLDSPDNI
jgi:hypothetical protein